MCHGSRLARVRYFFAPEGPWSPRLVDCPLATLLSPVNNIVGRQPLCYGEAIGIWKTGDCGLEDKQSLPGIVVLRSTLLSLI